MIPRMLARADPPRGTAEESLRVLREGSHQESHLERHEEQMHVVSLASGAACSPYMSARLDAAARTHAVGATQSHPKRFPLLAAGVRGCCP